jgi:CRISPR system Cascade subunit CasE
MYLSRLSLRADIARTQLSLLLKDRQGYGLHRLFWDLFGDGNGGGDKQQRDFLFREEIAGEQLANPGKRKATPVYYVLSKKPPLSESPLFDVDSKEYSPKLAEGDRLTFKLRVNAVVSREGKRHDIVMDQQQSWLRQQLDCLGLEVAGRKNELKARLLDSAGDAQIGEWKTVIENGPFAKKLEQTLGRSDSMEWAIKTVVERRVQLWWKNKGERLGFEVACLDNGEPILESVAYQKHHLPEKAQQAGFNSLDLCGEVIVKNVDEFQKLLFEGTGPAKAFGCGLMLIRRA